MGAVRGWGKPISFLWIDGSHEYEDAKADFLSWEPYLELGGVIAFHDWFTDGPRKLIKKYMINSTKFTKMDTCSSLLFATKVSRCRLLERLTRNVLFLPMIALLDIGSLITKSSLFRPIRKAFLRLLRSKLERRIEL